MNYEKVVLGGVCYAILAESDLLALARDAGVRVVTAGAHHSATEAAVDVPVDRETLARRLADRRTRAGLTQVELARRAGIRVETLNRLERGKTTPDFSTVRKLVVAMNQAEAALTAPVNEIPPSIKSKHDEPV